jgi:menaquinone-dependent protoporphyrinogen oxidase
MTRVLIVYATSHGHTREVAQKIADRLRGHDLRVQMADVTSHDLPEVYDFDIVVLGSRIHFGNVDRRLRAYATRHRAGLVYRPSYLFSVGTAAASPAGAQSSLAALGQWSKALSWTPRNTAAFAGALLYRSYTPLTRLFMRFMSRRTGQPTDTSRDFILTDWAAVAAFADDIARTATSPAVDVHGCSNRPLRSSTTIL